MADDLTILFHGEVQLLDWGDTRAAGPYIKLRFADPRDLDAFRGLDTAGKNKTGHILNLTIAQGDIAALAACKGESGDKKPYAEASGLLWKSAFFRAPDVWGALGVLEACELDRQRDLRAAQTRAWDRLKEVLGYESMALVPPARVVEWAREHGVERHLPSGYVLAGSVAQ